ncbi:retrovirus-related Pol polyprotein from transposon 17.6, partial [Nephila pilipes]
LALDLRLLNNVIDGCSYPLPKIQDITTKLAGFKLFTVLDLNSSYWQIHLPKEYRKFLTFTTPWKTFQFKRLPFGIKHAAAYFQSMMDIVLSKCKHNGIHCYQDDIIIAANSIQELNAKLNDVLSTLQENNLTLAPDKCSFATQEIQYLGFTISSQGITPGINNTDKICKFTTPENQKQLKRFLGMCGYYRHLIPDYATKVHLLNISSNSRTFTWTSEHQEKFQELQRTFFTKPFIVQTDWTKQFFLNTDGSHIAIAGILMQKQDDGELQPISYYSRTLTATEFCKQ